MMKFGSLALVAALAAISASAEEAARPTVTTKFGIYMPASDTVLHPGWRHPNKAPPNESDWRLAIETTKLPMFMANTGMLWGFEIDAGQAQPCTGTPMIVITKQQFPDHPEMFLNQAPVAYDRSTKTKSNSEIVDGCTFRQTVLFTPGDPVGHYKIAIWVIGMDELTTMGGAVGVNDLKMDGRSKRPADVVLEFDVYEPAAGETNPSAFAHCGGEFGKYDPKIVDCKPKLDVVWSPPK